MDPKSEMTDVFIRNGEFEERYMNIKKDTHLKTEVEAGMLAQVKEVKKCTKRVLS